MGGVRPPSSRVWADDGGKSVSAAAHRTPLMPSMQSPFAPGVEASAEERLPTIGERSSGGISGVISGPTSKRARKVGECPKASRGVDAPRVRRRPLAHADQGAAIVSAWGACPKASRGVKAPRVSLLHYASDAREIGALYDYVILRGETPTVSLENAW